MKYLLVLFTLTFSLGAYAEIISVKVKGMVCSFCVQGIEKKFKQNPSVESIKVDLDQNLVSLKTKDKEVLSDDQIKAIINDAGYSVDSISR